jgi:hypothetical protein
VDTLVSAAARWDALTGAVDYKRVRMWFRARSPPNR